MPMIKLRGANMSNLICIYGNEVIITKEKILGNVVNWFCYLLRFIRWNDAFLDY